MLRRCLWALRPTGSHGRRGGAAWPASADGGTPRPSVDRAPPRTAPATQVDIARQLLTVLDQPTAVGDPDASHGETSQLNLDAPTFTMPHLPALSSTPGGAEWLQGVQERGLPRLHPSFAVSDAQAELHALAFIFPTYWPKGIARRASMAALEHRGAAVLDLAAAVEPFAVGFDASAARLWTPEALGRVCVRLQWDQLIRFEPPTAKSGAAAANAPASSPVPQVVSAACVKSCLGLVHTLFGIEASFAAIERLSALERAARPGTPKR